MDRAYLRTSRGFALRPFNPTLNTRCRVLISKVAQRQTETQPGRTIIEKIYRASFSWRFMLIGPMLRPT